MTQVNHNQLHSAGKRRQLLLAPAFMALLAFLVLLASCQQESPEEPEVETLPAATVPATEIPGTLAPPVQLTLVAEETETAEAATPETIAPEVPGALISVSLESRVGVLLDEIPAEMRDRVAEALGERPDTFWEERARRQVRLTLRRLNFRNFVYSGKGQLPLPPEELWSFQLDPAGPEREIIQGHDVLVVGYTFSSTLLTDEASPAAAEPALAAEGGVWDEPFVLPVDPDLLLQRTNNACINEAGFPPNSYDSENAWVFYDYACTPASSGALGCHRSVLPNQSCREALANYIGEVETAVRFERLAWDGELAAQVRVGEVTHPDAADLSVVEEDLVNHRIIYRYFSPDSCAVVEQCVEGTGWRRLLQFDATVHNVGGQPLHIGPVVSEDPLRNLFQYNSCHDHFHFSNYGDFLFGAVDGTLASKQAFCVESTGRASNHELSPLTHDYTCRFQGVQAGWIDEYVAGLDCQWIDITEVEVEEPEITTSLTFNSNPDQFLCEGTPVLDAAGNVQWEPSGLTTNEGLPIDRPQCDFVPDWEANNSGTSDVRLPAEGSFVTLPCRQGELGPLRNCGFTLQEELGECTPGSAVQLSCTVPDNEGLQVLRLCEVSQVLGTGTACAHQDALANRIIGSDPVTVQFTCPAARDDQEPGGDYALYTAPVFEDDPAQPVTCTVP